MKNVNANIIRIIVFFLFSVIFIQSCKKDKVEIAEEIDKYKTENVIEDKYLNELININNPYDIYYKNIEYVYDSIYAFTKSKLKSNSKINFKTFNEKLKEIIYLNTKYFYPKADTAAYTNYENNYIVGLINDLSVSSDLITVTQRTEKRIIGDNKLRVKQKDRLLEIVSIIKFNFYFSHKMTSGGNLKGFDSKLHDCMVRELGEIFADDGNPIPEALFIVGLPEALLAVEAICIYEALFL